MNKEVNQERKSKLVKLPLFWWIMGAVLSTAILITIAVTYPLNFESSLVASSSNQQSNTSSSEVTTTSLSLVGIEVDKLPSKLNYSAIDTIETSGGELRLVFSDYSVRYVSMNDNMIDTTRLNTSSVGTTRVTLSYSFNGDTLFTSYNVNIVPFVINPTSLSIDIASSDVLLDQVVNLNYIIEPSNASYSNIVWSSSNPLIASVDNNGLVTPKNIGEVVITATVDNNLTATSRLNIVAGVVEVIETVELIVDPIILGLVESGWIPVVTAQDLDMVDGYLFGNNQPATSYTFGIGTGVTKTILAANYSSLEESKFILVNNIDLSNYNNGLWVPIKTMKDGFIFDGNDKTISNLKINSENQSELGLFSRIDDSEIYDLTLSTHLEGIIGFNILGTLSGLSNSSIITNVNVTYSKIFSPVGSSGAIGGLIGSSTNDQISNSSTNIEIIAVRDSGGLVGYSQTSKINNSSTTGSIFISGTSAGGIAGVLLGQTSNRAKIINSTSAITINGNNNLGGLVGFGSKLDITGSSTFTSSAKGAVYGYSQIGGLAGTLYDSTITNSISNSKVFGFTSLGGLVGEAILEGVGAVSTITGSTASGDVNGDGTNVGFLVGRNDTTTLTNNVINNSILENLTPININYLILIRQPVTNAVPVTAAIRSIDNSQFSTGPITWSPAIVDNKFAPGTVYTATINITSVVSGFRLSADNGIGGGPGVPANFFKIYGATSVTNAASSGVITAVFPATLG
jgi:hypothetical protein